MPIAYIIADRHFSGDDVALTLKESRAEEEILMKKMVSQEDARALLVLCDAMGGDKSRWIEYCREKDLRRKQAKNSKQGTIKERPLTIEDD